MVRANEPNIDPRGLMRAAFSQPAPDLSNLSVREWELLIRLARRCRLLARLADMLTEEQKRQVPNNLAWHFDAAKRMLSFRHTRAMWEINRIRWAMQDTDIPIILLKGTAYLLKKLPMSDSRLFADVDLLFPAERLGEVEEQLNAQGWVMKKLNEYDQAYYRNWAHELPPMVHRERETEVDIHHTILPVTSRLKPNPADLISAAVYVEAEQLYTLEPKDMLLHSVVHLFHDGELSEAFRELLDIDVMLRHFGSEANFWVQLLPRARALGLQRPLFYAIHFARQILETPVPERVLQDSRADAPIAPILKVMEVLVPLALFPEHPDYPQRRVAFARWCLYVRSHYLRMPMRLLLPHLLKKAIRRKLPVN